MASKRILVACLLALILFCPSFVLSEGKAINVGVFDIPPLSFKASEGKYDGLAITVLEHIAAEEGYSLEYVPCDFSRCLELLEAGEIDIQSVIAYSDDRAESFDFIEETLFNDWGEVYTRKGLKIESIEDLAGMRIALLKDTIQHKPFIRLLDSFNVHAELVETEDYEAIFEMVGTGDADALVTNRLYALRKAGRHNVSKTPIVFSPIDIRIAAAKGKNYEFLHLVDEHLRVYKNDESSLYYQNIERLFGGGKGQGSPYWARALLAVSVGAILLLMIFAYILQAMVRKRTSELNMELEERKKLLAELSQGKRDWEETFDTITDIITIHDRDFTVVRANRAASEELKMPWSSIYTGKCYEYYHGTDCPPDSCASCQSLRTGQPTTIEVFEPHLNRHIEIRSIPRKDSEGNLVGLIHVVRNITERKRVFDALKESERRNRTLLENIPMKIFYKNRDSVFISCNKAFASDLGIMEDEIEGKTDFDFFPEELAEKYRNDDIRIMEAGTAERIEEPYELNGVQRIVSTTKSPIDDGHGNTIGILGIFYDITSEKLTQEALKASELKYRTLVDNSLVGIFRTNLKGDILFINSAMVRMLGYDSQEDIMQRNIVSIYEHPEDRNEVLETFRRDGRVDDYELAGIRKNGDRVVFLVSSILEGDTISGMLIDITDRKKMERTAHLASIGELASGVAHEINNPTSSIMLNSKLLMKSKSMEKREAQEIYKRIYEDTQRITGIVKSLLSFARPETKIKKRVSVHDLIEDSLRLTRKHLEKNNIRLEVHEEEGIPEILVTPQSIEQVIINIISNAIYALNKRFPEGEDNKKLEINVSHVHASQYSLVRMEFLDLGCGIPGNILDRVKNPFFTTKPVSDGTGLGLSISHSIITDHGGEIVIDSSEGEFTLVRVDLPVMEDA